MVEIGRVWSVRVGGSAPAPICPIVWERLSICLGERAREADRPRTTALYRRRLDCAAARLGAMGPSWRDRGVWARPRR